MLCTPHSVGHKSIKLHNLHLICVRKKGVFGLGGGVSAWSLAKVGGLNEFHLHLRVIYSSPMIARG